MIIFIVYPLNEVVGFTKDCHYESLTLHYTDLTEIIKGRNKKQLLFSNLAWLYVVESAQPLALHTNLRLVLFYSQTR